MAQEDKLKQARKLYKTANEDQKYVMEKLFPELRESEDERTRKELITHCRNTKCVTEEGAEMIAKWIAWLEKQGEQPKQNNSDVNDYNNIDPYFGKPVDKVEPKFKVGDWITDGYLHNKITDVLEDRYIVDTKFVKKSAILFNNESRYHLWTIQDAKDGDVLQLCKVTAIFKDFIGDGCCRCYCSVWNGEFEIPSQDGADNSYGCHNAIPATKEQRDTLERAMTNAGYKWNKEELKLEKL